MTFSGETMVEKIKVRAELEEQRWLIEQQQVEIQRLRRRLHLQAQLIQSVQANSIPSRAPRDPLIPSRHPIGEIAATGMVATPRVLSGPRRCPQATKRES
jgi:hypothetical protein